jgi:hypothetical protein
MRLFVLFCLLFRCAEGILKPGTQTDIQAWGNGILETSLRVWDEPWLRRAAGVTHFEQLLPFIRRLEAGLPVNVVALGSSIVAGGGCFNDPDQLRQHVRRVRDRSNPNACAPPNNKPDGFLGAFMAAINATWPHKDHMLFNLGQPAADLKTYVHYWCYTGTLPSSVDLFIMEQHAGPEGAGLLAEQFYIQLATKGRERARPPPFIFVGATWVIDPWNTPDAPRMSTCLSSGCIPGSNCSDFRTAWVIPETHSTVGNAAEDKHAGVMHLYGFSEISLRALFLSAIRDRLFDASTPCALAHLFYRDGIHPTPTGTLLYADLLIKHLKDAVSHAYEVAASGKENLHVLRLPSAPVHAGAWSIPIRKCYDVDTSVGLPVVNESTTGWRWVEEQAAHAQYVKPGWISDRSGDVLTVRFSTILRPRAIADNVTLIAEYLSTYEHIGNATVTCVSGCVCAPMRLVGLDTRGRVSVESTSSTNVTQVQRCTVQVVSELPADDTSSKFKMLGMELQTHMNLRVDLGSKS